MVNGEGELPLSQLVRSMKDSGSDDNLPRIPGVISKKPMKAENPLGFYQLPSLNSLPTPDYNDYFELFKTLSPENQFFPTLPVEISRGCWWRSKTDISVRKGCTFCNLNLQWLGYRSKEVSKVVSELDYLTSKHKTLSVAFMDNAIPLHDSREIFSKISKLGKNLHLFAEIRAITPHKVLKAMQAAGTEEVQIGIEALSTRLLKIAAFVLLAYTFISLPFIFLGDDNYPKIASLQDQLEKLKLDNQKTRWQIKEMQKMIIDLRENPVLIKIYSISGQLVRTLDLGHRDAGIYASRSKAAYWDGKNESGEEVTSGVYFYSITVGGFSAMRKMIVRR